MAGKRKIPGLGLTAFWPYLSSGWNTEMDANLVLLSAITGRLTAESRTTNVADMDKTKVYIVPSNAGSNPNKIAVWNNDPVVADQAWIYIDPLPGWTAFIVNEAVPLDFLYGAWAPSQFTFSKSYMENGYDQRWLTDLTLASGWTQIAGRQALRYRRAMTFVDLDMELTAATMMADGSTIFTLPAGYRPPAAVMFGLVGTVMGARILIGVDGTVKCYGMAAVTGAQVSFHGRFSLL